MEKIKDLSKVILTPEAMLGEIIKPKRFIIAPDGTKDEDSYIVVIKVGTKVDDIQQGDIIIKYGGQMTGFPIKDAQGKDREYVMMHRGAVLVAIKPDNFIDPDKITEKVSI
jgi:hypothetical protein